MKEQKGRAGQFFFCQLNQPPNHPTTQPPNHPHPTTMQTETRVRFANERFATYVLCNNRDRPGNDTFISVDVAPIWSTPTTTTPTTRINDEPTCYAEARSASVCAVGTRGGQVYLCTPDEQLPFFAETQNGTTPIVHVALSPDGLTLCVFCNESIGLWNVRTGLSIAIRNLPTNATNVTNIYMTCTSVHFADRDLQSCYSYNYRDVNHLIQVHEQAELFHCPRDYIDNKLVYTRGNNVYVVRSEDPSRVPTVQQQEQEQVSNGGHLTDIYTFPFEVNVDVKIVARGIGASQSTIWAAGREGLGAINLENGNVVYMATTGTIAAAGTAERDGEVEDCSVQIAASGDNYCHLVSMNFTRRRAVLQTFRADFETGGEGGRGLTMAERPFTVEHEVFQRTGYPTVVYHDDDRNNFLFPLPPQRRPTRHHLFALPIEIETSQHLRTIVFRDFDTFVRSDENIRHGILDVLDAVAAEHGFGSGGVGGVGGGGGGVGGGGGDDDDDELERALHYSMDYSIQPATGQQAVVNAVRNAVEGIHEWVNITPWNDETMYKARQCILSLPNGPRSKTFSTITKALLRIADGKEQILACLATLRDERDSFVSFFKAAANMGAMENNETSSSFSTTFRIDNPVLIERSDATKILKMTQWSICPPSNIQLRVSSSIRENIMTALCTYIDPVDIQASVNAGVVATMNTLICQLNDARVELENHESILRLLLPIAMNKKKTVISI
jgi:hypothetical protein